MSQMDGAPGGSRSRISRVKRSNQQRQIRCVRCGETRLLPLTVHVPQPEYKEMRRRVRPVRAELKCVACGHRHLVEPRLLLAS